MINSSNLLQLLEILNLFFECICFDAVTFAFGFGNLGFKRLGAFSVGNGGNHLGRVFSNFFGKRE